MTDIDKIKRRISAILAKAEDGSGTTEEEAASALEFARRLMLRHQLTESDLGEGAKRTPSEIAADTEYAQEGGFTSGRNLSAWEGSLAWAVVAVVGTVGVYVDGQRKRRSRESGNLVFDARGRADRATRLLFYGPAEDARDAAALFEEWSVLIAALARMKYGGAFRGEGRSYAEGFVVGLHERLRRSRERERAAIESARGLAISSGDAAIAAQAERDDDQCSALVVVGANAIMEAKKRRGESWLKDQGVRLSSRGGGGGGAHHGEAFGAGQRDGRSAGFSRTRTAKLGGGR